MTAKYLTSAIVDIAKLSPLSEIILLFSQIYSEVLGIACDISTIAKACCSKVNQGDYLEMFHSQVLWDCLHILLCIVDPS